MKPTPLTPTEQADLAARLPSWQVATEALQKTFEFKTYLDGIEFVRRLALAAEAMNHHPDLSVGWRKVTVKLCTHSVGAVTAMDETLAMAAETLFEG